MAERRVVVVGPIAWDTVLHTAGYPRKGQYTQCLRHIERPGGSSGNVAQALATTGTPTIFVTALGRDDIGERLKATLDASPLAGTVITWTGTPSNHVLVLVDDSGDRTILGITPSNVPLITLRSTELCATDIVVFPNWSDHFLPDLDRARSQGCTTIVGLGAIDCPDASADIAFGSRADLSHEPELETYLHRFSSIVMTAGALGAEALGADSRHHQPAIQRTVVDTTGAGDAFLAGYLAVFAKRPDAVAEALLAGAQWAAEMITREASIPPPWDEVQAMYAGTAAERPAGNDLA
jgi:ribokinase